MITLSPRRLALAHRLWPCGLVVLAVAVFDLGWHEPWRDEVGAMLTARAVPWPALLRAMRYEGVPPLFHALLKLAGAVLPNPAALVLTGALGFAVLLAGTYRLLVSISRAPGASARLTFAFSLTYAYGYELGVVVRQYALGLGLALLGFSYLRDALRATAPRHLVRAGALAAGLAALASAHAACVAGAGLLAFGVLSLARGRRLRAWPILLTLPVFAFVAYLASPFPERIAKANVTLHLRPASTFRLAVQALVDGVMPADWWLVESMGSPALFNAFCTLRSLAFWCLLAAAALGLASRAGLLRRRGRVEAFDLIAGVAAWPPLLEIIVRHYWGFYRHHLFLGMPLLVIVAGWGLHARFADAFSDEARRSALALLAPWFLLQVSLAALSVSLDAAYPFTDTRAASRALVPGAHVVAEAEWRTLGMLFWRPDIQMRAAAWQGRPYRYIQPDNGWGQTAPLPPLVKEECRAAPDRTYFAGGLGAMGALGSCAKRVAYPREMRGEHPTTWETFELFRMDCGCVEGKK